MNKLLLLHVYTVYLYFLCLTTPVLVSGWLLVWFVFKDAFSLLYLLSGKVLSYIIKTKQVESPVLKDMHCDGARVGISKQTFIIFPDFNTIEVVGIKKTCDWWNHYFTLVCTVFPRIGTAPWRVTALRLWTVLSTLQ